MLLNSRLSIMAKIKNVAEDAGLLVLSYVAGECRKCHHWKVLWQFLITYTYLGISTLGVIQEKQ